FGSSKLYHYAYPFLPPLMLAAGYLVALVIMLVPVLVRRAAEAVEDLVARAIPRAKSFAERPWTQHASSVLIVAAAALAIWALIFGQARLQVGSTVLFKSGGVIRPIIYIMVAAIAARRSARVAVLVVALGIGWWLPADPYKATITRLTEQKHPLRDLSD